MITALIPFLLDLESICLKLTDLKKLLLLFIRLGNISACKVDVFYYSR